MRTIRIFVSSPGDVQDERNRARQVIERLRRRYVGRLQLEPVLWEDMPLQPYMSFQQQIDVILSNRGIDVAIFVLWSRLGSPPNPAVHKPDGEPFASGTEREYQLMKQAHAASTAAGGEGRPPCLVYL